MRTTPITHPARAGLLAAIAALMPAAAQAGDVPGSRATAAKLPIDGSVSGVFEIPNDADWYRARLYAGHAYALGVSSPRGEGEQVTLAVRDAAGRVIAQKNAAVWSRETDGLEFRAPYNGAYLVSVQIDFTDQPYPVPYGLRLLHDCLADRRTRCTLAVGETRRGATASGADKDWFAAPLVAGAAYDVTLDVDGYEHCVNVRDATGALVTGIYAACADFGGATLAGFRPPRDGTYFVEVLPTDASGSTYGVGLAPAAGARR